jgi:hypothetical protein
MVARASLRKLILCLLVVVLYSLLVLFSSFLALGEHLSDNEWPFLSLLSACKHVTLLLLRTANIQNFRHFLGLVMANHLLGALLTLRDRSSASITQARVVQRA